MKNVISPAMPLLLMLFSLPSWAAQSDKPTLVVFAAASLTNALQEVGDDFTKSSSIPVKFSFAASSALAHQIENGAPADVFFSADIEWMDYLQSRKQIQISTRHDVLANHLVLVAPADSKITLKIAPHFPLATILGADRLTTGDPDSVPVGRYAREALTQLGVWNDVEKRLVRADSVRSALAFVDRGEAALGIVYATDAEIDKQVRVVDVFPTTPTSRLYIRLRLLPSPSRKHSNSSTMSGARSVIPRSSNTAFSLCTSERALQRSLVKDDTAVADTGNDKWRRAVLAKKSQASDKPVDDMSQRCLVRRLVLRQYSRPFCRQAFQCKPAFPS
jgi:molybdate transport system substrate-binding protein